MSHRKSTPVFLALMLILSGCLGTSEPGIIDVIDTTDGDGLSDNSTDNNSTANNPTANNSTDNNSTDNNSTE
ncbi:MAG: hypothetical protein ACKVKS_04715, partial [Candidatus Poseidoniales archaeon]